MKKFYLPTILTVFLIIFGVSLTPFVVQAGGTCTYSDSSQQYICTAPPDGQSPPPSGGCGWISSNPADGMLCDHLPAADGYTDKSSGGSTIDSSGQRVGGSCFSTGADFLCMPDQTPRPSECTSGAPGENNMRCSKIPAKYTCTPGNSAAGTGVVCTLNTAPVRTPSATVQPLNTGSACAGPGGGQLGYCPLEPLPGLPNPANITLPDLLNALFKILLSLGALFAVVMLTLGGLEYMVSAVPGVKSQGRERAWAAIWGLLLLAASYLILYTINPNLTKFTLFGQSSTPQSSTQTTQPNSQTAQPSATNNVAVDTTIHTFTPSTIQWNAISNSVCGTKLPCDFILGTVTNVSSMDGAGNIYPDLVTFITQCTAGRYDQVLNKDRAGAIRAYNAELVGEPGRTGLACLLQ